MGYFNYRIIEYFFYRATNEDEMCNFYLMYWVQDDEPLNRKYCFSAGPPAYYWQKEGVRLPNIPDEEASELDAEEK